MIWLDAHLSPRIAKWLESELDLAASSLTRLGLSKCEDAEIFKAAREAGVVFLTKDQDFAAIVTRMGPPPHVIWLRVGNASEEQLKRILTERLREALDFIEAGEILVEIQGVEVKARE